jgi:hypothetical protein
MILNSRKRQQMKRRSNKRLQEMTTSPDLQTALAKWTAPRMHMPMNDITRLDALLTIGVAATGSTPNNVWVSATWKHDLAAYLAT